MAREGGRKQREALYSSPVLLRIPDGKRGFREAEKRRVRDNSFGEKLKGPTPKSVETLGGKGGKTEQKGKWKGGNWVGGEKEKEKGRGQRSREPSGKWGGNWRDARLRNRYRKRMVGIFEPPRPVEIPKAVMSLAKGQAVEPGGVPAEVFQGLPSLGVVVICFSTV